MASAPAPAPPAALSSELIARFRAVVGTENCISNADQLVAYECDALPHLRARPGLVVLPQTRDEVVRVVRLAYEAGLPIVPRGSGTGLSGGAMPITGCVLLGLSRMRRILEIDLDNQWMRVEPGVVNLDISKRLAPHGYYYAPDPSSAQICSIGGNVAENSGGAHCLKYGFTTHHVLGAELVLADGRVVELGGPVLDAPGYDLRGALVGSEGTLGVVTQVTLRICRFPETTRTLLATFPSTAHSGNAVSLIIASGILPAAIEMMDQMAIDAVRRVMGVGWPEVSALLLMDVDGTEAEVEHTAGRASELCREAGAIEVRKPSNAAERDAMWKGRKSAFTAMGRLSPNYIVQDGVIPRSQIARVLTEIARLSEQFGVRVANVFHAGDGNLHPLVLYDASRPEEAERAERCSAEIVRLCVSSGGSITGEHGVGADKAAYMGEMFSETDLETMNWLRCSFDPETRFNPGKVFPTPRLCGDRPGHYVAHPTEVAGQIGRG
ncbi:MAG TPA: FAD-linked oxidase C-terminal domain-containing protein [Polyangiaceae bacterium]|nr:FAD-linked oxidase C-terminal domain-containing protein [Polyangiaceae bacterium]